MCCSAAKVNSFDLAIFAITNEAERVYSSLWANRSIIYTSNCLIPMQSRLGMFANCPRHNALSFEEVSVLNKYNKLSSSSLSSSWSFSSVARILEIYRRDNSFLLACINASNLYLSDAFSEWYWISSLAGICCFRISRHSVQCSKNFISYSWGGLLSVNL
jgi:hypothetical protein